MKIFCRSVCVFASARALVATSPPAVKTTKVDVFIESTDAFQVVFYANYFKFFRYGLDEQMLTSVDDMKYKEAAVLGDELEVRTTSQEEEGYFHQSIVRAKDGAVLVEARTGVRLDGGLLEPIAETEKSLRQEHVVRFDDIDAETHGLSLDAALRGFERGRSSCLGGPDALKEFQEDDVTVVVCRVDNLRYVVEQERIETRDMVFFETSCRLRSNRFIVFDQQVSSKMNSPGQFCARATITCVCLDSVTNKPRPIPEKLRMTLLSAYS